MRSPTDENEPTVAPTRSEATSTTSGSVGGVPPAAPDAAPVPDSNGVAQPEVPAAPVSPPAGNGAAGSAPPADAATAAAAEVPPVYQAPPPPPPPPSPVVPTSIDQPASSPPAPLPPVVPTNAAPPASSPPPPLPPVLPTNAAQPTPPPPPPPPVVPAAGDGPSPLPPDDEEEGMTMLEHLEELRTRIIIMSVALMVGLLLAAIPVPGYTSLTHNVIAVVNAPAAGYLQAIKPGEIFLTYLKVALVVAGALAMPVLIYQMMAFIMPALHPHEKKYLYMAAPGVTVSFVIGIVFGYLLLLPFAINFLLNFGVAETGVEVKWSFGEYVGTVTTMLFWMGLAFETPLVMFFLAKLRVVNVDRLVRIRKYAFIGAFIVGAIITPTPDPLNQTIISVPLYLLFELGILMARLA